MLKPKENSKLEVMKIRAIIHALICHAQSFEMFPENFYTSFTSFMKLG